MSKGQRGNKEAKKPRKPHPPKPAGVPEGVAPTVGGLPRTRKR